jgi:hypothetical protein
MSTTFKGPVVSQNGFTGAITGAVTGTTVSASTSATVGTGGTALTLVKKGTIAVTLAATLAAAEEDVSLTIAGATAGDIVIMTPLDAAMETGVAIVGAWVSAANTVKVRITNVNGSTLTGSTANWQYCLIRS